MSVFIIRKGCQMFYLWLYEKWIKNLSDFTVSKTWTANHTDYNYIDEKSMGNYFTLLKRAL